MAVTTSRYRVLAPGEGLSLQSGPGRDLLFKVPGQANGSAVVDFDESEEVFEAAVLDPGIGLDVEEEIER